MHQKWEDIRDLFASLAKESDAARAMQVLVEQIIASPRLRRLYGDQSMIRIAVSQLPLEDVYTEPHLMISHQLDGTVEFVYLDTGIPEKLWRRVVPEAQAF